MHINVSSANISLRDYFWTYVILSISFVLLILIINNSTPNMNTNGDTASPLGTPCSRRIYLLICLQGGWCWRKLMTDGPKLNILRHSSMYLCERESNAFLKSMSRIRDSIFFILACFIRFMLMMMQDPITFLGTYAFCFCPQYIPLLSKPNEPYI